jgi:pyridoxal phosphate-dependent aminotransferase EpsN
MAPDVSSRLERVLSQNWIANMGPSVDAFERELAQRVGAAACLATHSATAALHLALRLLQVEAGDSVFCSALTFVASANPILYMGALPVFIDAEPGTGNMSPLALERALEQARREGKLPKAIVVVHLYGQMADMRTLLALAGRYAVPIVEDAAQALGSTYRGRLAGTLGLLGVYSFAGNKIITTSTGGALVSDDARLIARARYLSLQARDGSQHYEHAELGYNYRMSNVLAEIGRSQLAVLAERVAARRTVFARYRAGLSRLAQVSWLHEPSYGLSNHWLSVLMLEPGATHTPDQLVDALAERGIEGRRVFKPMHRQRLYADAPFYAHGPSPVADRLFERGVCLPSSSSLSLDDQRRVIDALDEVLSSPARSKPARREPRGRASRAAR